MKPDLLVFTMKKNLHELHVLHGELSSSITT